MENNPSYDYKTQNHDINSQNANKPNRLIHEKSPYLLQHAYNPVDWYPWGDEAFEKAKREDKPVFLSIGYSTCHWCHVMERESFEDEEVAAILNQHYVSIKVDREERPDVDHIYMAVCQTLTGQGGWPLTVLMTPERKPFFAGTYFPKEGKWGRPGIMDVLLAFAERWEEQRQDIDSYGDEIIALLKHPKKAAEDIQLTQTILDKAYQQLESSFDPQFGGFGSAPKFPTPHNLLFLLRYWKRTGKQQARDMVEKTLTAMRQGGIYDHLGYGFARYSTDKYWLAPHFEKMLYDNALLSLTYLEAYQCTGNADFARVAEEILIYVLRDMTSEEGGFYSAEDADSEGIEGKFYVFTKQEVFDVLGKDLGELFAAFYDISDKGNFEHGTSIINYIGRNADEFAESQGMNRSELEQKLTEGRIKLYQAREKRIHPYKDDKILTAWNGLMIVAFARAARVLNRAEYAVVAERALEFVFTKLARADGRLLARYRDGETAYLAYLDDYAFITWALLEMYETVFSPVYLHKAVDLVSEMRRLFWDEMNGGFYFYGSDGEELISRPKELYDSAIPSGNSVAAYVLQKLARLTGSKAIVELAEQQLKAFAEVEKYPQAYTFFLMAVDYHLSPYRQIVIAGKPESSETWKMLCAVGEHYLPDMIAMYNDPSQHDAIAQVTPNILNQCAVDDKATAYICENYACMAPIIDPEQLSAVLGDLEHRTQSYQ